jgi:hypothetical protein
MSSVLGYSAEMPAANPLEVLMVGGA